MLLVVQKKENIINSVCFQYIFKHSDATNKDVLMFVIFYILSFIGGEFRRASFGED